MLCKIFPYSISRDAFSWFSQLRPGSLTSWEDVERAFLYKFFDDAEETREKGKNDKWDRLVESWQIKREHQIPRQFLDYIMLEGNKQQGSEELSRAEEAETSYPTSTSITTTTSTSIDTSTTTSIDSTTKMSTNGTTSTSIDGTTLESIAHKIPASIDGDSYFQTRPLKILERSSCPQDIIDSTLKSIDISSCDPTFRWRQRNHHGRFLGFRKILGVRGWRKTWRFGFE